MRFRLRTLVIPMAVIGLAAIVVAGLNRSHSVPWAFTKFALNADSTIVYEGLPHPLYEKELLQEELRTKETQELERYPFYHQRLELIDGDKKKLTVILANHATWRQFTGEKKCGGFHPYYAVEFVRGADRYLVLLCFGCGEAKVFNGPNESRYDVSLEPREILDRYQKNRPPSQKPG